MDDDKLMESAILGLMLLGRTREEAIREIHKNDEERMDRMVQEWYDSHR